MSVRLEETETPSSEVFCATVVINGCGFGHNHRDHFSPLSSSFRSGGIMNGLIRQRAEQNFNIRLQSMVKPLSCRARLEGSLHNQSYWVRLKGFYVVARFSANFSAHFSEAVSGRLWCSRGKFKTMQAF